jgi:selenocysteine-specific elongation factor
VASPAATLGGGTVIETGAARHRAHDAEALERLELMERGGSVDRVGQALDAAAAPVSVAELARAAECTPEETAAGLGELLAAGRAVRVGQGFMGLRPWSQARSVVLAEVQAHRREFPVRFGIGKGELKSRLQRSVPAAVFDSVLAAALSAGALYAREDHVAPDPECALPPEAARAAEAMMAAAAAAGLQARSPNELAALGGAQGQEILARLIFERRIVKLAGDLAFDAAALERAATHVAARLRATPRLAVADFKEMFGLSRKFLVPLLEHLDALGVTRREGDVRVAGKKAAKLEEG